MHDLTTFHWQEKASLPELRICFFAEFHSIPDLSFKIRSEYYQHGPDTGSHLHHDFYALYVVLAGQGIHNIDQHPYGIARGDVYLLTPKTIHAYHDYQNLEITACYFQPQLFSDEELSALQGLVGFWRLFISSEQPDKDGKESKDDFINRRLHLPPERLQVLEPMLKELHSEFLALTPESSILVHQLFFRLLVYLARWQTSQVHSSDENFGFLKNNETRKNMFASLLHFCEEHYAEPLTVPQMAAMMFLSPGRFTKLFSHEVGISPAAYIRRLRLDRAQTLLRTTSRSNTSIAHEVGFTDSAQFSRAFRAVFHLTPSAYRAHFQ